jgi:PTH1 family peptidyl-tRNA hydrolase
MFLLAGLGNPGAAYAGHRHNAGFMALDAIAARYRMTPWKETMGGRLSEGEIAGERVLLFKPMGYMNTSGGPVGRLARFRKIPVERLCVIHDELDLPVGKLRTKRGGGNGGHNGLKSIDAHMGVDYLRLRVGIGHPGDKDLVHAHVLSNFQREEAQVTARLIDAVAEALPILIAGDESSFMNKIALSMQPTA